MLSADAAMAATTSNDKVQFGMAVGQVATKCLAGWCVGNCGPMN